MENIYKNIVKIRKKLGYSQEYMSEEMNIMFPTIQNWKEG